MKVWILQLICKKIRIEQSLVTGGWTVDWRALLFRAEISPIEEVERLQSKISGDTGMLISSGQLIGIIVCLACFYIDYVS